MTSKSLEELYKTTVENLEYMRNILIDDIKRDNYTDSKYKEIIDRLNAQYNKCKKDLDDLNGFK